MAAPTFVASYGSTTVTDAAASLSVSITYATGDVLVLLSGTGYGGNINTITAAAGLTWTLQQSQGTNGTEAGAFGWTATAGSSGSGVTLTVGASDSANTWGFQVIRFSGSGGVGASGIQTTATTAAPAVTFSTAAHSAVAMVVADFNAGATTGATYTTATAGAFTALMQSAAANVTDYIGYYADTGAAGSDTVGMSAPTGQQPTTIAIEVLGSGSTPHPAPVIPNRARICSSNFL